VNVGFDLKHPMIADNRLNKYVIFDKIQCIAVPFEKSTGKAACLFRIPLSKCFPSNGARLPSFWVTISLVSCYASSKLKMQKKGVRMSPVRWDPLKDVAMLQDRINRAFDDAFGMDKELDVDLTKCAWRPVVDIFDTGEGLKIKAELPGLTKEDISVELRDNVLALKGERCCDSDVCDDDYHRKERCFGTFQRTFRLPFYAEPGDIRAGFKDGILTITIPRSEENPPRQIAVDIE
jgi:HSP20 family protein